MRLLRIMDHISNWSGKIASFLILAMIVIVGYEVVLRYVFDRPTLWAHESAQFVFGAMSIMGGAYVLYRGAHVKMDVVYSRCSPRKKAILDLITAPIFFCFAVVLLWTSGEIAWESLQELERSNSQWRPPIYPIKMLIPVAALLLLLQGIAKFVRDIFTGITGKELS